MWYEADERWLNATLRPDPRRSPRAPGPAPRAAAPRAAAAARGSAASGGCRGRTGSTPLASGWRLSWRCARRGTAAPPRTRAWPPRGRGRLRRGPSAVTPPHSRSLVSRIPTGTLDHREELQTALVRAQAGRGRCAKAGAAPALRPGGGARARSHCRLVPPLIRSTPEPQTDSVRLLLMRPCDRTLGSARQLAGRVPRAPRPPAGGRDTAQPRARADAGEEWGLV